MFKSIRFIISLYTSIAYLREVTFWKGEVETLVCVQSLLDLFYGLTTCLSNLCKTASIITSYSMYGVKSIGLPGIGSSTVDIEARDNLNVEYFEIDLTATVRGGA